MSALEKLKQILKDDIEYYSNPSSYEDSKYYIKCDTKVDYAEEILSRIERLEEEEKSV